MGKANDRTKTQDTRVMRRLPSQVNSWEASRSEILSEVGGRAVCDESRKHGSEGGQGFLRVRLSYPTREIMQASEYIKSN